MKSIKMKVMVLLLMLVAALPALAQTQTQMNSTHTVSFDDFSFRFDSAVATNVNISQFPGDPVDLEQPGGPEVAHTQFLLYNQYPAPESIFDAVGGVRVYVTADIQRYTQPEGVRSPANQFEQLQDLLNDRPDLTTFLAPNATSLEAELPFLPMMPATQVIRARPTYVETGTVRGVSYVTVYRQDVAPFAGSEFLYTFQGVSADGQFYVAAIFRVNASMFPQQIEAFDPEQFAAEFPQYLTDSVTKLNAASPEDFTPSLAQLDAIIQSFAFGGAMTGPIAASTPTFTPAASDPTLGGLAGMNWTLVSYGPADAPVTVLPEAPITAVFSQEGVSGSASCNSYFGGFEYSNGQIAFRDLGSTLMACAEPVMAQETAYLEALRSATSYQVTDGQLQIFYEGGVLTFTGAAQS